LKLRIDVRSMADHLGNSHVRYVLCSYDALLASLLHPLAAESRKASFRQSFPQRVDEMRTVDVAGGLAG